MKEKRAITFRSWLDYGDGKPEMVYFTLRGRVRQHCEPDKPIMQFTGLHDRHGNAIYEGDILKVGAYVRAYTCEFGEHTFENFMNSDRSAERTHTGFYLSSKAYTNNHKVNYPRDIQTLTRTGLEIIGNIFENPELIK